MLGTWPNEIILVLRVTRPYLNLLVKPSLGCLYFRLSGKYIKSCILKGISPYKIRVTYPILDFQTCYPKHPYFLFGLTLTCLICVLTSSNPPISCQCTGLTSTIASVPLCSDGQTFFKADTKWSCLTCKNMYGPYKPLCKRSLYSRI